MGRTCSTHFFNLCSLVYALLYPIVIGHLPVLLCGFDIHIAYWNYENGNSFIHKTTIFNTWWWPYWSKYVVCHGTAGRITSSKKSNDLIGNWTGVLPSSSIVPQPTTVQLAGNSVVSETILGNTSGTREVYIKLRFSPLESKGNTLRGILDLE
jgi:hypothetical protein